MLMVYLLCTVLPFIVALSCSSLNSLWMIMWKETSKVNLNIWNSYTSEKCKYLSAVKTWCLHCVPQVRGDAFPFLSVWYNAPSHLEILWKRIVLKICIKMMILSISYGFDWNIFHIGFKVCMQFVFISLMPNQKTSFIKVNIVTILGIK